MSDNASMILNRVIGNLKDVKFIVNNQKQYLNLEEKVRSYDLIETIEGYITEIRIALSNAIAHEQSDKKLLLEQPEKWMV